MPLTQENHFTCGLKKPDGTPDCDVDFHYNPGNQQTPYPGWPPELYEKLVAVRALTLPLTGHTTFYCSDLHLLAAIERGQHLPPAPPKVIPAGSKADMDAAARGACAVTEMKQRPS